MNTKRTSFIYDERKSSSAMVRSGLTLIELIAVVCIIGVLVALLIPATQRSGGNGVRRSACKNNLKYIALALHNYHDDYGVFPPAYIVNTEGLPLHSWRTLLLPYVDQKALYDSIDLSKPWDDPANQKAFNTVVSVYSCPSDNHKFFTEYLAVVGKDMAFDGARSRKRTDITDSTSKTIMVVEVPTDRAVHWMSPKDADEQLVLDINKKSKVAHKGGVHVMVADGSVRFLSSELAQQTRQHLMTINQHDEDSAEF